MSSDLERQKIDLDTVNEELLKMKKENETELYELKIWQDDILKELIADGIEIEADVLSQLNDEETVDEEIATVLHQIQQVDEDMEQAKAELKVLEDQMSQKESLTTAVDELALTISAKKQKIADLEKLVRSNPPQAPQQANAAVAKPPAQPAIYENPVEEEDDVVVPDSNPLNVTALNVEGPRPSAQSTPMVMSSLSSPSLKGLINTAQVSKMMLSSAMHQQVESPIPQRKLMSESSSSNRMEIDSVHGQGAPVDLHNNHQYSSHQSRYESQVVQHQFSPTHRQSPKIVTVQSPTFSLNTRSAEASPRSTGSTDLRSAIMLRSPLTEESEREYMKMRKSSQPREDKEDKESDSGTSFGSFGFGGKFGFSSRDDNQDDDNNRFGGFSGSGGGFGFSF